MTEVHNDQQCKPCVFVRVRYNVDFDGKLKRYCVKNQAGLNNCKLYQREPGAN